MEFCELSEMGGEERKILLSVFIEFSVISKLPSGLAPKSAGKLWISSTTEYYIIAM